MIALKGSNFSFPAPLLFQNKDLRIFVYKPGRIESLTDNKNQKQRNNKRINTCRLGHRLTYKHGPR